MNFIYFFLGLITGSAILYISGRMALKNYLQRNRELKSELDSTIVELKNIEREKQNLLIKISANDIIIKNAQIFIDKQKEEYERLINSMNDKFSVMAEKILEEKSSRFSKVNEEIISGMLSPLKDRLIQFEHKIEDTSIREVSERASLRKEIEQISAINKQMTEDARRLTEALKGDNKIQGDWGEFRLETILEKSGLENGINYRKQESFKCEDGALKRPDFIINLPDGKHYVIDCKVSLTSYERFFGSTSDEERKKHIDDLIASLTSHINGLNGKFYNQIKGLNQPDFVFLYVPIEPALTLALKNNPNLYELAWSKNIILISSSLLFASMRTVAYVWKQEKQRNNVLEIAKQGGALYDKFVSFFADMENIGKSLDNAYHCYEDAMKKLSESDKKGGTIIGKIEKLRLLGAETSKQLPKNVFESNE